MILSIQYDIEITRSAFCALDTYINDSSDNVTILQKNPYLIIKCSFVRLLYLVSHSSHMYEIEK